MHSIFLILVVFAGDESAAKHSERHGQLQDGGLCVQRGGYTHQVDVAL
jgi:hypothetical protein